MTQKLKGPKWPDKDPNWSQMSQKVTKWPQMAQNGKICKLPQVVWIGLVKMGLGHVNGSAISDRRGVENAGWQGFSVFVAFIFAINRRIGEK